MVIFRALRATLVHFADFVTGHGTSCAPCAVCHTLGALCTFIRAYSIRACKVRRSQLVLTKQEDGKGSSFSLPLHLLFSIPHCKKFLTHPPLPLLTSVLVPG